MRSVSPDLTLLAAEDYCGVQGIRLAGDISARLDEVRGFMRSNGVRVGHWWVCERSTPADLEEQLLANGLVRVRGDYEVAGMLLGSEPPAAHPDIETRRVRNATEYADARELVYGVFNLAADRRSTRAELEAEFVDIGVDNAFYGAWIDGELVGVGRAFFAPQGATLSGGATLERARGRGVYSALVRARWDEVVRRGGGVLVVQAGSMSEPILRRLGFERVLQLRRLEDVPSKA